MARGTLPPLRVAVIADIHANLAALEACLDSIDEAGVDEIWCLGDIVGYGAEPDACADLVRERCSLCLAGNHDLAVLGELDVEAFSESRGGGGDLDQGQRSASATLEFLGGLEPAGQRDGVEPLPRLAARPDLGVRADRASRPTSVSTFRPSESA